MSTWVKINSNPPTEFWSDEDTRAHLTTDITWRRLESVGVIRSQASVGGGTENANVSVSLGNGDGVLTSVFEVPPLKAQAEVLSESGGSVVVLFSGLVSRLILGNTVTITLEA